MTQRRALQTRILKMENYEQCWLHRCIYGGERTANHLECLLHRGNLLRCCRREVQVQSVLKLIWGTFFGYVLYAGRIWKGDIMVADIEELEEMDASELHARRLNGKEVLTSMKGGKVHIPRRGRNSQSLWRKSTSENIHLDQGASWTRRGTRSSSRRIRRTLFSNTSSSGLNTRWCGSFKWFLVYCRRFHLSPSRGITRVKLYVSTEESFPIPLKYKDVARTTHTSLDVLLEKNIDDYWNVYGERELSDAWTVFTRFILLNERPPDG